MRARILLDACVLYPTLMRQMLVTTARAGAFEPLWSPRILDEWRHAAARSGPVEAEIVRAEIALLTSGFPGAMVAPDPDLIDRLSLPDPDDRHVLAAALSGRAEAILTANLKDFPTRTLSRHGVLRYDPDGFFCDLLTEDGELADTLLPPITLAAEQLGKSPKSILKKSRLPRLAKRLGL
ncbi:RSP_2648 family PIN domain-containing protein [Dinoroseobacter sp. S375]|uniref:RSP_2648 family PIN domain-containing protein n=1 Tax=Dinoroseobacter sp. S375 TaxID=3415136 RepID=UPI003C7E6F3B